MVRPATAPPRRFSPSDLKTLEPALRQQLCHALLVEAGLRVTQVIPAGADAIDFIVATVPLWRQRRLRVRLLHREARQTDIKRLGDLTMVRDEIEAVLMEGAPSSRQVVSSEAVMLVRAPAFIDRLNASAIIKWRDNKPVVDREIFQFLRRREAIFGKLDAVGVRWLPWLARNKIPPLLQSVAAPADALLEQSVFRIFTMLFRFSGRRLGSRQPGQIAPDSILHLPSGKTAAILDCKAARDGYAMSAADYRALRDYAIDGAKAAKATGRTLDYVIVVSSFFKGAADGRHPYFGRARKLKQDLGLTLVYLTADDLARFSLRVEELDLDPEHRNAIRWEQIFDLGRPQTDHLIQGLP